MSVTAPVPRNAAARQDLAEALALPIARVTRTLGIGLAIAVVVIFGWAVLVPISSGAVAEGRVAVENKRKTIQHLDGGIVQELAVREGAKVKAGQLLIRLDDGDARAAVQVLQAQVDSLMAEKAAREAELTGASTVTFPAELLDRAAQPSVQQAIATQRAAFAARRAGRGGEQSEIDQKLVQLNQEARGSNAQSSASAEQIALLEREIKDTQALVDKGYATRPRLLALQRAAAELKGQRSSLDASSARARAQMAEARIARSQVNREGGVTAADALRSVQADLVQTLEKLTAAKDVLSRKRIVAPVDGTVVGLAVTTIRGVIRPGEALMDIVPTSQRIMVEAQMTPQHADDVRPGQQAFVRLEAGGSHTAPVIEGVVRNISADALTDQRSGERYFSTTVEILSTKGVPASLFKPGLPAAVLVKTGERTTFGYFMEPITKASFGAMRE